MNAYIIVESKIIDAEKLKKYSQQAAKTVQAFDGEFIAKSETILLAGESQETNGAVIKFDSKEIAEAWYRSKDYQALIPLRDQAMKCIFKLVNGL
jgi:uncharacterized protein (DUF1330 family)